MTSGLRTDGPTWPAIAALGGAVVAISTSAILIQAARPTVPALALATWRLVLAALVAGAAAAASPVARRQLAGLDRRAWRGIAWAACCLAAHFGLWVPSVTGTKIVSSVALVTTSPLWVALLAPRFLGERVGWRLRAAVGVGAVGAVLIVVGDALTFGAGHVYADGLALGGALAVALYFIAARRLRQDLGLAAYLAAVYGATALVLLAAALATRTPLSGWDGRSWALVVGFAALPQIIGHSTLNWALARLNTTYVAMATLCEPVGSTLLAWRIFGQAPLATAWLGGSLVLAALGWATWIERRPAAADAAPTPDAPGQEQTNAPLA